MNKKVIFLIIALFSSVFVVTFLLSMFIRNNQAPSSNQKTSPTSSPSPTPGENELVVTSILPVAEINSTYLPFQKITVSFNEPVLSQDLFIETIPNVQVEVFQGASLNEVFIVPSSTWPLGKTELTILQTTTSINGKGLRAPVIYSITTALPTLSPEELEGLYP